MKALTLFNLPHDVLSVVFNKLPGPVMTARVAEVCSAFKEASEESVVWNKFLKPEFRTDEYGEAKKRFMSSPEMREEQYVRVDKKGREWLKLQAWFKPQLRRMIDEIHKNYQRFSWEEYRNICAGCVQELIESGHLSIEEAMSLSSEERENLTCQRVIRLVISEQLSIKRARRLSENERVNLDNPGVELCIALGKLNVEQAMSLSTEECENLRWLAGGQELIGFGYLTIKQAMSLSSEERENLTCLRVIGLVLSAQLSIDRARRLSKNERINLDNPGVELCIALGKLNVEQAMSLSTEERRKLNTSALQKDVNATDVETVDSNPTNVNCCCML